MCNTTNTPATTQTAPVCPPAPKKKQNPLPHAPPREVETPNGPVRRPPVSRQLFREDDEQSRLPSITEE